MAARDAGHRGGARPGGGARRAGPRGSRCGGDRGGRRGRGHDRPRIPRPAGRTHRQPGSCAGPGARKAGPRKGRGRRSPRRDQPGHQRHGRHAAGPPGADSGSDGPGRGGRRLRRPRRGAPGHADDRPHPAPAGRPHHLRPGRGGLAHQPGRGAADSGPGTGPAACRTVRRRGGDPGVAGHRRAHGGRAARRRTGPGLPGPAVAHRPAAPARHRVCLRGSRRGAQQDRSRCHTAGPVGGRRGPRGQRGRGTGRGSAPGRLVGDAAQAEPGGRHRDTRLYPPGTRAGRHPGRRGRAGAPAGRGGLAFRVGALRGPAAAYRLGGVVGGGTGPRAHRGSGADAGKP